MKYFIKFTALIALLITSFGVGDAYTQHSSWINLINGDNLEEWIQRGGEAEYVLEDGVIVGQTVPDTPNSFLCTKDHYCNFELEFEVKVDEELNSGVQIRSNSYKDYRDGRVHGYQVEIDPSSRSWSGGIYDEARRGWLYNLEDKQDAQNAFKNGKWNKFRVLAKGNSIKTWVNGVQAADLNDEKTSCGFIGLQVHSTDSQEPLEVRWRNVKIRVLD